MASPERLDDKQIERAKALHKQGITIREIARRFEISKTTLHKILTKEQNA